MRGLTNTLLYTTTTTFIPLFHRSKRGITAVSITVQLSSGDAEEGDCQTIDKERRWSNTRVVLTRREVRVLWAAVDSTGVMKCSLMNRWALVCRSFTDRGDFDKEMRVFASVCVGRVTNRGWIFPVISFPRYLLLQQQLQPAVDLNIEDPTTLHECLSK